MTSRHIAHSGGQKYSLRVTATALAISTLLAACLDSGSSQRNIASCEQAGSARTCVERPANPFCVAPSLGVSSIIDYQLQRVIPQVAFSRPVKAVQAPNEPGYWYVAQQSGQVMRVANSSQAGSAETYFSFDAGYSPRTETGLLGIAFSPQWPTSKTFYIAYAKHTAGNTQSRVSRIRVLDDSVRPVVTSAEEVLLRLDQPASNHNGGDILFGPDGYLYTSFGDGGGANDVFVKSQITTHLFSALLRIDVENVDYPDPGYLIPGSNPFFDNPACGPASNALDCPEIFAHGFRNPWRFSIDHATQRIWLADVGQNAREEINIVESGGNYGWACREGTIQGPRNNCPAPLVEPVHDYAHAGNNGSVTGGFVYRGSEIGPLQGQYVFGDYLSGQIWTLAADGNGGYTSKQIIDSSLLISSFAEDLQGEIYLTDYIGGGLYKIVRGAAADTSVIPQNLSQNSCVESANPAQAIQGMIAYRPNAPFWSDGADKSRWIAIPDGSFIDPAASNTWRFPPGTVAMKNFVIEDKLIETRFFMRHPNGDWAGYSYEWNEDASMATRVTQGKLRPLTHTTLPQQWVYPSEDDCLACHTAAAGHLLGLNTPQLNGPFDDTLVNAPTNQLETLNQIAYFDNKLSEAVSSLPAMPDPFDTSVPLTDRAKAYLHINCASCHQPDGNAPVVMDLRYTTSLANMGVCNIKPQRSTLGIANAKLVAAGDTSRSIIYQRMNRRDADGMPPIGSNLVDTDGLDLIGQWILLLNCN
ncbi:MAG: PQQ-dependent sugar dehydrogenase [Gammaproteobacteria bacterium]|nr:PQQ-dependent sugar dehydrogenase [Gammaproteobacteria bacterium]